MTEYTQMKRLCFAIKNFSDEHTAADMNTMITQSCQRAFEQLDDHDRVLVQKAIYDLETGIDRKGFSHVAALEVLASVAGFMEGSES